MNFCETNENGHYWNYKKDTISLYANNKQEAVDRLEEQVKYWIDLTYVAEEILESK